MSAEPATGDHGGEPRTAEPDGARPGARPSLAGIPVRVWAELGRARMPSAEAVALSAGAVVDLDRTAEEPIDVFVNGRRFATGRLVVVDGTDWAVRIEEILDPAAADDAADAAGWLES